MGLLGGQDPLGGARLGPGFHQLEHFWPSCHLPGRATGATPGRCQDSPQPVQMDPVSPVSAGTPVPWLLPLSPAPWLHLSAGDTRAATGGRDAPLLPAEEVGLRPGESTPTWPGQEHRGPAWVPPALCSQGPQPGVGV